MTEWNARMRPERLFFYQHGIASNSRWSIVWIADFYRDGHGHTSSCTRTALLSILQCCWTSTLNKLQRQCWNTVFPKQLSGRCLKKRCLNIAMLQHKDASNMKSFIHNRFEKQFGSNPKVFLCINWAMINDISGRRKGRGTPYGTKAGFATISRIIPITNMNHEISINYK